MWLLFLLSFVRDLESKKVRCEIYTEYNEDSALV